MIDREGFLSSESANELAYEVAVSSETIIKTFAAMSGLAVEMAGPLAPLVEGSLDEIGRAVTADLGEIALSIVFSLLEPSDEERERFTLAFGMHLGEVVHGLMQAAINDVRSLKEGL